MESFLQMKDSIYRKKKSGVVVVDSQPLFRLGLAAFFESTGLYEIRGEADSYSQAMKLLRGIHPEILVVDIYSRGPSGLDFIREVLSLYPSMKVLVFTMSDENVYAERALKAGASGYLQKTAGGDHLIDALNTVLSEDIYVSDNMSSLILQKYVGGFDNIDITPAGILSDREFEVFSLTGKGLSSRNIALMLNISIKTVDNHKAGIKDKMGFKNSMELLQKAALWVSSSMER